MGTVWGINGSSTINPDRKNGRYRSGRGTCACMLLLNCVKETSFLREILCHSVIFVGEKVRQLLN